jgi:hypothetical protein
MKVKVVVAVVVVVVAFCERIKNCIFFFGTNLFEFKEIEKYFIKFVFLYYLNEA